MAIETGKHLAKIVDCGIKKSKAGNNMAFLAFELSETGQRITWNGSLKEGKAQEITLKTLLSCGFNGDWEAFASAPAMNFIFANPDKEFELVVVEEEWSGKVFPKIQYINDPDNPYQGASSKVEKAEAVEIVKSMNLKAATIRMKQEMQAGAPKPQTKKAANDSDDIPF